MGVKEKLLEVIKERGYDVSQASKNAEAMKIYVSFCTNFQKDVEEIADDIEAKLIDNPEANIFSKLFVGQLKKQYLRGAKKKKKRPQKERIDSSKLKKKKEKKPKKKIKEEPISPEPTNRKRNDFRSFEQLDIPDLDDIDFGDENIKKEKIKLRSKELVKIAYNCLKTEKLINKNKSAPEIEIISSLKGGETYMTRNEVERSSYAVNKICDVCEKLISQNKKENNQDIKKEEVKKEDSEEENIEIKPIDALPNTTGIFWGRLLSENGSGFEKLNASNIVLEGFKNESESLTNFGTSNEETPISSKCIKLNVDEVKNTDILYPGKIVAVKGKKVDDPIDCIEVEEIFSELKIKKLESKQTNPVSIILAAGPLSTSDNLTIYPLKTILEVVNIKKPDLLMLIGPFIDQNNYLVKEDNVEQSYDEIFEERVIEPLKRNLPKNTKAILIPSLNDVHHDFVFPQPPFQYESLESEKDRIICLSNPSIFKVNGVPIGVCSNDVISQVKKKSYKTQPIPLRAFNYAILDSIVHQGGFNPFNMGLLEDVPMEYQFSKYLDFQNYDELPRLIITPSREKPFIFSPDNRKLGIEVLNPNMLTRGRNAGVYFHIQVPQTQIKQEIKTKNQMEVDTEEKTKPFSKVKIQIIEI